MVRGTPRPRGVIYELNLATKFISAGAGTEPKSGGGGGANGGGGGKKVNQGKKKNNAGGAGGKGRNARRGQKM